MTVLILGVALWWAAHLFKRVAPAQRQAMGNNGKLLATGLIVLSIVLMVVGYRAAPVIDLWTPPAFLTHVNNLLMILAFYFYAASGMKTALARKVRHPQLAGFKTWAIAHLLVNGDLASLVLFGGLLAWAVVSVIVINRAQPTWTPPAPKPAKFELFAIVGTLGIVAVVMLIHYWLGVQPWG